eukprot:2602986-Rhodomonas_salina.2
MVAAPGNDVSTIMIRRSVPSVGPWDIGLGSVLAALDNSKSSVGRYVIIASMNCKMGWNVCCIVEA